MILEEKILEAKVKRRKHFVNIGMGLIALSLLCSWLIYFLSTHPFAADTGKAETVLAIPNEALISQPAESDAIADDSLRQTYINALTHYQNNLIPELNKIDLTAWDKVRSEGLALLKDKAIAEFTAGNYATALNTLEDLNQAAQTTIDDSQQAFRQALSNAEKAYGRDDYDDADDQITQALMFDKTSVQAMVLSAKIDQLPEILPQLEKIENARVENNLNKELSLIKDLLQRVPDRTGAIERKQVLINSIGNRDFNTYITQSYQALKQGNTQSVKQKIASAKKIAPNRKEIIEVTRALQQFETRQRFKTHQQKAQIAISSDDWITAKKQLGQALQEQSNDTKTQQSLAQAISIVALNDSFKQHIKDPYHLSNKQLASKLNNKINQAAAFSNLSPSLAKNANALSRLIKNMNTKVSVGITSDEQTTVLVRGVGVVGKTQSKTIQLLPGKYTFEGKRKGFKSKLIHVEVPHDKASVHIDIRCDEHI